MSLLSFLALILALCHSPISIEASGMLGVPGIFTDEQKAGWKKVVDAVHAKGSVMVMQCASTSIPFFRRR
jgi:2,4-dienoyl-CoA reductase-like NADH-dependent reductase (Old Yellow Enzyme family)